MLQRVLEPEVMSEWEDADCYDQMDHTAVNRQFVADLLAASELCGGRVGPDVADLGCGTALIPIELCETIAKIRVMAIDASSAMLELARYRIEIAGLRDRIQLKYADVASLGYPDHFFDTVVSNSIVHHLAEPTSFFAACARLTKSGGLVFVRDLFRPDNEDQVEQLVQLHTAAEPPMAQQLFRQSLHAALTLDEVRQLLSDHGLDDRYLTASSDRHWTWFQSMP